MSDANWRYSDARPQQPSSLTTSVGKRPRSDYDATSGHDLTGYYAHEEDRGAIVGIQDTDLINASYDRYLRGGQISAHGGGQSGRPLTGGILVDDPRIFGMRAIDPGANVKDLPIGFGGGRQELPLPPDATSTLFVEGLPSNCKRREVAHIFRPFVGYKEVRLVIKEARTPGKDPPVLCFVDFVSPAHAATALDALQGYPFDEDDPDSTNLRLQFARNPGVRAGGGGHRGKR